MPYLLGARRTIRQEQHRPMKHGSAMRRSSAMAAGWGRARSRGKYPSVDMRQWLFEAVGVAVAAEDVRHVSVAVALLRHQKMAPAVEAGIDGGIGRQVVIGICRRVVPGL